MVREIKTWIVRKVEVQVDVIKGSATPKVLGGISDFKIIESGVYLITWSSISGDIRRFICNKKPYKVVRHSTTLCCNFMVNIRTIYGIYSKIFKISDLKISWDLRFQQRFQRGCTRFQGVADPLDVIRFSFIHECWLILSNDQAA